MIACHPPVEENTTRPILLHLAWVRWWSALAYYAYTLAAALDRIGHPSRIVAPPGSPLAVRAADAGLAAPEWGGLAAGSPSRTLAAVRRLRAASGDGRIGAVFVHTGPGHLSAALALHSRKAPLLRIRSDIRRPSAGPAARWLYATATRRVLISGEFMRGSYLRGLGIESRRVVHLPAGFDLRSIDGIDREARRGALRLERGWPAGAPVVGMLARYSPVKGHRVFVEAAREIAASHPQVRFLTAGSEGQVGRDQVAAWVAEAGLSDRFAVLGAAADPLSLAAGLDLAVIASTGSEAVCRSALEYMALGIPIVATAIHVIPETVGDAGILVAPGDAPAAAEAMMRLLSDPAAAAARGAEGRRRVAERFDADRIAARAAAIVEEAAYE